MERDKSRPSKFKRVTNLSSAELSDSLADGSGECSLSGHKTEKRMKKDDSGIAVDKSQNSSSDADEGDESTPPEESAPASSKELNSSDSGNQENNDTPIDLEDGNSCSGSPSKSKTESDSVAEAIEVKDPGIDSDEENKDTEVQNYDPTPSVPKPKHNWTAPIAVIQRQYGSSVQYQPHSFRHKCYGSLHMVERLELMYKMKKHEGCVNTLNFNSSGTRLISSSDDFNIVIWDWTISEPALVFSSGHRSNVFQAKYMPLSNDRLIASCGRDGQVIITELSSSGATKSTKKAQHKAAAHKLSMQPDCPNTFLSCGEDAAVFEIDQRAPKIKKLLICKEGDAKVPLYSVFTNPSKSYQFVIGGRDEFVRLHDKRFIGSVDNGIMKKFCPKHLVSSELTPTVTSVVFNYNGEEILASYNDDDIYLFATEETDCNEYLHRYRGHRNSQTVKGVNFFGPKSEYVISGSDCGYIFFWDKKTEHIVKYMHGDEVGVVNCLEPNPNVPVLASSGLDDDIKIWVPSCEVPPDLSGLKEHITKNVKQRDMENREFDSIDDQIVWYLMQHLGPASRNRSAHNFFDSSNSSSTDSDSHDEEDIAAESRCSQS